MKRSGLITAACAPFDLPALRDALAKAKQDAEQTIDTVTIDKVIAQGFDPAAKEKAQNLLKSFTDYIQQHQAEITALQMLYRRPYGARDLNFTQIKELADSIGVSVTISEGDKAVSGRKGSKVAAKYRNPHNPDQTWTGRGVKPRWLAALVNEGRQIEEFLI